MLLPRQPLVRLTLMLTVEIATEAVPELGEKVTQLDGKLAPLGAEVLVIATETLADPPVVET
jgi:hypothetical protein